MRVRTLYKKGFILIEVLVAFLILSTGILFLIQALSGILESNQQLRNNRLAFLIIDNTYNRLYSHENFEGQREMLDGINFYWDIDTEKINEALSQITVKVSYQNKNKLTNASLSHVVFDEK